MDINNNSNGSNDVINGFLIYKLEVVCKGNVQQKKVINLVHVDHVNYKFTIITKIYLFKNYMDIMYVDETCLMFAIYYSKSQW